MQSLRKPKKIQMTDGIADLCKKRDLASVLLKSTFDLERLNQFKANLFCFCVLFLACDSEYYSHLFRITAKQTAIFIGQFSNGR